MPIYEYECSNCHHQFDVLQKIHDEPVKTCASCGKDKAVRLVSAAGFQLKGTGWYATDFKNKGKPEKKSNANDSNTPASKESKPAETKTETATVSTHASSSTKGESD
jgi:putative FmdB family regulatory protein